MENDKLSYEELLIQNEKLKQLLSESDKIRYSAIESEEKYQALYNNAPLSYQSLDENGCFIDINPMWLKTLGYERIEVIGKWYGDFLHPDYVDHFRINFPAFKKRGYVSDVQFKLRKKDNSYIYVSFEGCIGYTPEGKFKQTYCVFKDITEQKAIEKALIKAKEKAEESDRLKSAFLANMSHEIRTPMNGILGFSQRLGKSDLSESKKKQYLEIIQNSGNQLMSLIDDLIDISKIEANQMKITLNPVNLCDITQELFTIFQTKSISSNIQLSININPDYKNCEVLTDGNRLRQILINLIGNSFKFTYEGNVKYGFEVKNDLIEFFVEDTGIGIPHEMQSKIFDRFTQVETEYAKLIGGTGLGLAISKSLVELLGGKIWLSSELGKGTIFYFTIPNRIVPESSISILEKQEKSVLNPNKYLVLIAEDEQTNYLYLSELLMDFNIKSVHARNGKEAIEFVQQNSLINLVLMDLKMPILNGIEATKEIKKIRPDLPIIAQTAYAQSSDKDKAIEAGCDDYISKPIMENILKEILLKYTK